MILLDTTPLVALCDPRDALHRRALSDLDRLGTSPLVVCPPVLAEACFLLSHAIHRQRLAQLLLGLGVQPLSCDDEKGFWFRVFSWLDKYAEHDPDWADGYLVIASTIQRRAKIWTYDGEFRTTWRREDGSKVPLATK